MRHSAMVLNSHELVEALWNATDVAYYTDNDVVFERSQFRGSIEEGLQAFNNPDVIIDENTYGIIIRIPEYHPLFNSYLITHEDEWCIDRLQQLTHEHTRVIRQLTDVFSEYITELSQAVSIEDKKSRRYEQ